MADGSWSFLPGSCFIFVIEEDSTIYASHAGQQRAQRVAVINLKYRLFLKLWKSAFAGRFRNIGK